METTELFGKEKNMEGAFKAGAACYAGTADSGAL